MSGLPAGADTPLHSLFHAFGPWSSEALPGELAVCMLRLEPIMPLRRAAAFAEK